ncbi:dirigent protein 1 [Setaria italica]|nr:dirigent protein 1 [Setaria italica]
MAPSLAAAVLLFLLAPMSSPAAVLAADGGTTTHLHLFMHDILTGSNPTAVQVIKGPSAVPGLAFGDTTVIDDALTEDPSSSSAAVGRVQGFYMMTSQSGGAVLTVCANLLLTAGGYNGSTVAVMGRDDIAADVRELAVVGGTGRFRMATGYVLWKTNSMNGPDATVELDVYVTTGGGATIDSSTPVGGSSSAAAVRVGGWVSAVFVAVVVAVVGSYV